MDSSYLGGCVHRYEHHVRPLDLIIDVGGKEQVAPTTLLDHVQQPGLVDGQVVGVPRIDLENDSNESTSEETNKKAHPQIGPQQNTVPQYRRRKYFFGKWRRCWHFTR